MRLVAESFTWPFRGAWRARWLVGVILVLFLPVTFVVVLGYWIAAIRSVRADPAQGPPPWSWSLRLVREGLWTALAILLITAPFAIAYIAILGRLPSSSFVPVSDQGVAPLLSALLVLIGLALPWGLTLLVLMPHCSARFAETGRGSDILDFKGAVNGVVRDFAAWNATAAAIVTGWAIGLACTGLLCAGAVPGIFYAILVSAHASAALHRSGPAASAR